MMLNTGVRDSVAAAGNQRLSKYLCRRNRQFFQLWWWRRADWNGSWSAFARERPQNHWTVNVVPKQTTHTLPNPPVSVPGVSGPQTGAAIQSWPRR